MSHTILILTTLYVLHWQVQPFPSPHIEIFNKEILQDQSKAVIFADNTLNQVFDDTVFQKELVCRNDYLEIVNFNNTDFIIFSYTNMLPLDHDSISVQLSPNQEPKSYISNVNDSFFELKMNCSGPYDSRNYFNEVKINLAEGISFSFLLNCDPENRHKQFQVGYILLAIINATIIIGVAMYSHVWSIRINLKPLRLQLQWIPFLIFSILGDVAIILLLKFGFNESGKAFSIIRYFGIVLAIPFTFLCLNEIFFIISKLKKRAIKFVRWCDIISIVLAIVIGVLAFFFQNWIYYNFLAGFICVGSIKIFHFNSLKQAFASMAVLFMSITLLTIVLHYMLTMSYNDYAGELSSPLFLQVPDLVFNLFKKCSWLPILDIILPGVTLSYLRVHDENKSSKWGGVYTVIGNLAFVLATIIWIGIEYVYPYSVPFSLIAYPILMFSIFIVAWRRGEWPTLLHGQFFQEDHIDKNILEEDNRKSLGEHLSGQDFSELFIKSEDYSPNNSSILTSK